MGMLGQLPPRDGEPRAPRGGPACIPATGMDGPLGRVMPGRFSRDPRRWLPRRFGAPRCNSGSPWESLSAFLCLSFPLLPCGCYGSTLPTPKPLTPRHDPCPRKEGRPKPVSAGSYTRLLASLPSSEVACFDSPSITNEEADERRGQIARQRLGAMRVPSTVSSPPL